MFRVVAAAWADSSSSRSWSGNPSAFPKNNQSSVRPGIFCASRMPMLFDNGKPRSKLFQRGISIPIRLQNAVCVAGNGFTHELKPFGDVFVTQWIFGH
ncbi:hypothetical protein ACVWXM_008660 [Bradyrhizobium sp. GM7.3]